MTVTFEDATRLVLAAVQPDWNPDNGTLMVPDYGWQDGASWAVLFGAREWFVDNDYDFALMDGPVFLVDNRSGELTRVNGLRAAEQVRGMTPVGQHPVYA